MSRRSRVKPGDRGTALNTAAVGVRQIGALRVEPGTSTILIESRRLDAPPQVYDADSFWVEHATGRLSLFFAKRSRTTPGRLQSCLEIRYPPEDFIRTFWRNSLDFIVKVRAYVAEWPGTADAAPSDPNPISADKFHSEWVSFTSMSHSGTEASIDFYHISTSALARFSQSKDTEGLKLRGVVRVQMTTFDLLHLIERLEPIAEGIAEQLPERHRLQVEKETDAEADHERQSGE